MCSISSVSGDPYVGSPSRFTRCWREDNVGRLTSRLVVLAAVLMLPCAAFAQATIAGVVRESSGAVLPGVTVEASSPALTEKVRTVVTDGTGQYRIVTLPPGTYVVKFSLAGFTTVQRDEVTVSGSGVIPINAEMQRRQRCRRRSSSPDCRRSSIRRRPAGRRSSIPKPSMPCRSPATTVACSMRLRDSPCSPVSTTTRLMPGMSLFSGARRDQHGGAGLRRRRVRQRAVRPEQRDAVRIRRRECAGNAGPCRRRAGRVGNRRADRQYHPEVGRQHLQRFGVFQRHPVSSPIRQHQRHTASAGNSDGAHVRKNWDASGAFGGPIARDRLWFFANLRSVGISQVVAAGLAPNLYLGDPTQWLYAPNRV